MLRRKLPLLSRSDLCEVLRCKKKSVITLVVETFQHVVKIQLDIYLHVSAVVSSLNVSCCVAGSLPNFGQRHHALLGKNEEIAVGYQYKSLLIVLTLKFSTFRLFSSRIK